MSGFGYFQVRGRIVSGNGQASRVGQEARNLNARKAVVVTEKAILDAGIAKGIIDSLAGNGVEVAVFDRVHADPSVILMDEIGQLIKDQAADLVVGVGGGSSLDAAKGAAIVATCGGSIRDYVGENKVPKASMPVIAIPTTAGTGSEVTWHISVNDTERQLKVTVRSPLCVPDVAILDATLMASLPAHVAAFTGMDAFTHAFESYISTKGSWQFTDMLALKAIELIGAYLRPFVANRQNAHAGENMLIASMLGGMVLSHARTGIVHQMARPLGAHFHIPHGLANSMLLPYAMEYTVLANPPKFAAVARALGVTTGTMSEMEAARAAVGAVKTLCADVGLPGRLRDVGVTEDKLPKLAEDAMQGKTSFENPRQGRVEDLVAIYQKAY